MLITLSIGILAGVIFMLLLNYAQKSKLLITWWEWTLTVLALLFAIFTAEVLHGFLGEGATQAALVMGLIFGLITVIWFVLLGRFVFTKRATAK